MRFRLLLVATLAFGCKGKPTEQTPDPTQVKTPGSDRTAPVENAPTKAQQKDIVLPQRADSAPIKTTTPLTPEKMKALAALQFDEWTNELVSDGPKQLHLRLNTKSRPFVMVTVVASPCDPKTCIPMDLATWRKPENEAMLKFAFNKNIQAVPGVVSETGTIDFFGQKMIYEYHLGETTHQDEVQNVSSVFGHAYTLFWNDGVNQIHVTAEYRDMPAVSQEALGKIIPRASFETIARAFMDYFTHAWS